MAVEVCHVCKSEFEENDMVKYGEDFICAECKPEFFQKIKEGAESTGDFVYAGFWIRAVAAILDGIITQLLGMAAGFVTGLLLAENLIAVQVVSALLGMLIAMSYEAYLVGAKGATFGKMALGLRVINADGSKVSFPKAFGRYFSKIISTMILMIGYIMVGFDEEKRGLHDRILQHEGR